jgi:hypothetical protein
LAKKCKKHSFCKRHARHINKNHDKAIMGLRKKRYCTSSSLWHQSIDCHVIFDKSNSTIHQIVVDTGGNPVSLTLVANLPPVSTTPAVPVPKYTAGVVDTSGKFATGVVDSGGAP